MNDVIIKSHKSLDHLMHLRKFFDRLRGCNLKLIPTKCAFRVIDGELMGFIVKRIGVEIIPS